MKIKQAASLPQLISWGLPQGSALSPTLYNLFISDIPTSMDEETTISLYADDTIIYTRHRLIGTINSRLAKASDILEQYYKKWKISINKDKTSLACFTNRKTKQLPDNTLEICGSKVEWKKEIKYLGVILDSHLTLQADINRRCMKFDNALRAIYPYIHRESLTNNTLKVHLYRTYLRPLLTYAEPLILNTAKSNFLLLERKQSKCLRMMLNIPWQSMTSNKDIEHTTKIKNLKIFAELIKEVFVSNCAKSNHNVINALVASPYM